MVAEWHAKRVSIEKKVFCIKDTLIDMKYIYRIYVKGEQYLKRDQKDICYEK